MQDKDLTKMYRNNHGFTLIEIIAVLVIMSIIAAGVLVRTINTDQLDLMAQVAKIRNHIRYAQAMALKRSDKNWGIKCDGSNAYWFFEGTDPDDSANQLPLPGEISSQILFTDIKVTMEWFELYFDKYGRPYTAYTDKTDNSPVSIPLPIKITGGSGSVTLSVTPETGLIQ
jgi:prepilin-type N-terminal cleavage/methylation domain-containing protein